MRLFISAGEPSGDLHSSNLIHHLRQQQPNLQIDGFGGERMAAAGCHLLYPLAEHPIMGAEQILAALPRLWRVRQQASDWWRKHRPDALLLVDYPGFHWWLARSARAQKIPVFYYLPPQLWAWASWRVGKMRRLIQHTFCVFPFEEVWFTAHGVPASYHGGHPYFDELRQQRLDPAFLAEQARRPGTIVGILPGSRDGELHYNLDDQLTAAARIHAERPEVRFLVACFKEKHRQQVEARLAGRSLPIEVHVGRTPEIIELAHCCLSVSGSVSLELLFRTTPAVMVYRHHWFNVAVARVVKRAPYITLVNLIAQRELFPEGFGDRSLTETMVQPVLRWLSHPEEHQALCRELAAIRERVANPGASARIAAGILAQLRAAAPARVAA
jgi:lipid-A-disaccharide synthase